MTIAKVKREERKIVIVLDNYFNILDILHTCTNIFL